MISKDTITAIRQHHRKNVQVLEAISNILKPYKGLERSTLLNIESLVAMHEHLTKMSKPMTNFVAHIHELNKKVEEMTMPIRKVQQEWIHFAQILSLQIFESSEEEQPTTLKLVRIEDGKIMVEFKGKSIKKANSIHLLVLKALLSESDDNGFISYDQLDEYLLKHDKKEIKDPKRRRKRILNARLAVLRFLGIPSTYNGHDLIERIEGKGLKLYNPMISK